MHWQIVLGVLFVSALVLIPVACIWGLNLLHELVALGNFVNNKWINKIVNLDTERK